MTDIDDRLHDLDSFRSPVTWADVERRPPRPPSPDRPSTRLIAGGVAFAVFAGGGWLAWSALGTGRDSRPAAQPGSITARFEVSSGGHVEPSATLVFDDRTQDGVYSSFGWENAIYDTSTPELNGFVAVPEGSELVVEGTAESVTGELGDPDGYPFETVERLDLSSGRAILGAEPGTYALKFRASWPEGTVPFYFGIEIVEVAASSSPAPSPTRYETDTTVLDDAERPPVLCLGGVADSLPPQCGGVPVEGWDWDSVEGEQTASGSTWGTYHVVGTFDGTTFTVLEAGAPPTRTADPGDPVDTPCAEPEGGWTSPDISKAGDAEVRELARAMDDEPDLAGFWIDYVQEPTDEAPSEPGDVIAVIAFTGDPETRVRAIRELWGGPLCLVRHDRTYDELRRIQTELSAGAAHELGLEMTWSGVDIQSNVVELGVVVAGPAERAAVDERYGEGAVELVPALVPVG